MTNEKRLELERCITMKYVVALLDAGYLISVNDGEEITLEKSTDRKAIRSALFTTDEDTLLTYHPYTKKESFVFLVYGNAPGEVVNDYGVSLEDVLAPVNKVAEQWA